MHSLPDKSSDCLANLVLIAFLECLQPREASVSLAQFHTRNFSPHPQLTRDCICLLIKQGRVSARGLSKKKRGRVLHKGLEITNHLSSAEVTGLTAQLNQYLKCMPFDSDDHEQLKCLNDQLKVYECVEYCRYYLDREGVGMRDDLKPLAKLQLMLLELAQEQVFMVIWRAVKNASEAARAKNRKTVSLNELINLAYKYFISYRRRDIQIDFYRAPYSIISSALRSTLLAFNLPEE